MQETRPSRVGALLWPVALLFALILPAAPAQAEEHEVEEEEIEVEVEEHETWNGELAQLREEAHELWDERTEGFLSEHLPEAIAHVERLRERVQRQLAPEDLRFDLYESMIHLAELARELAEMREHLPQGYEKNLELHRIELHVRNLAEEYNRSTDAERRKKNEAEVRKALAKAFELSQGLRELEAREIEQELNEVRGLLKKRAEHRDLIIERRAMELLHGEDPFAW